MFFSALRHRFNAMICWGAPWFAGLALIKLLLAGNEIKSHKMHDNTLWDSAEPCELLIWLHRKALDAVGLILPAGGSKAVRCDECRLLWSFQDIQPTVLNWKVGNSVHSCPMTCSCWLSIYALFRIPHKPVYLDHDNAVWRQAPWSGGRFNRTPFERDEIE